jgi:hypothetical protein
MFRAEYSTTAGEMWVNGPEFDTEQEAWSWLRPYASAGNWIRVVPL